VKRVKWPAPETIGPELVTPLGVMEVCVFSREHVRDRARVSIALDVAAKLEASPIPDLTDEEWELLCSGLVLPNEKIIPAAFNRYVLRCLRALHQAESCA
jgi:hypothetical protein